MISFSPTTLEKAVSEICPDIEARVLSNTQTFDERRLWHELSCCLLSSQVPYPLAVAAADAIDQSNLLIDGQFALSSLSFDLHQLLLKPLIVAGKQRLYRFPKSKAHQLAAVRVSIALASDTLESFLYRHHHAEETRVWLVKNAPGIGPKQASMFLRNSGISYELAVLDRHVLNYMTALGLFATSIAPINGLVSYRQKEVILRSYASRLGVKVGILDWAIWIVMKQVRSFQKEAEVA
jgi:N-glycosylase/DNA lyase